MPDCRQRLVTGTRAADTLAAYGAGGSTPKARHGGEEPAEPDDDERRAAGALAAEGRGGHTSRAR